MPVEDIEGCIRCVKTALPHLNPAEPADRERISREFNKFLRDPGRKYKGELERLEAQNADLVREKDEADRRLSETAKDLGSKLSQKDAELAEIQSQVRTRDLRSSAFRRLVPIGVLGAGAELAVVYAAIHFGGSENDFQKLKDAWEFLALPLPCAIGLSWFVLGQERIEALGWSFKRLLAGSDD